MRFFASSCAPGRCPKDIALVALAVLALDQFSKWWLIARLGLGERPPVVLTDFFSLVMVWNHGVSFGMLAHGGALGPFVLITLALAISVVLVRLALKSTSRWERVSYALVIGGALSNALDRARVGAVADFFYFHVSRFSYPAFNVADSAICVGVALLLFYLCKHPARP
jgi:signal peptidase II